MKLYIVFNGYQGNGTVKVLVVAESEEKAIELARPRFKREAERPRSPYNGDYYKSLVAECVCDNLKQEWASEVFDY